MKFHNIFSFAAITSPNASLANNFFYTLPLWNSRTFCSSSLPQHFILYMTKAAFHLASSSCRNFVTRSLNCKYSKEANCIKKTWVFCWNTLFMHLIDNNMFSSPPRLKLNCFLTWKTKSFFCALYMLMKLLFRTTWIRLLISLNSTLLDLKSMCKCYS